MKAIGLVLPGVVFPAQAGVILIGDDCEIVKLGFPRASGGDPQKMLKSHIAFRFSPRKRG